MFEHLPRYAGDPILGLMSDFFADPRIDKVNLGVGIYYDELGQVPLLDCVAQAEQVVVSEHKPRSYLPMEGESAYRALVHQLIFADSLDKRHFGTSIVQTVGGSGALKVGADFLRTAWPGSEVWVSDPTWDNHLGIFEGAGLKVNRYPYYDPATQAFDYEGALAVFKSIPVRSIVLLHPCCHNPTGIQPTREQWIELLDALQSREAIPFLDIAYQGFGQGLDDDAWVIRECAHRGMEFLVSSSFSKTFSLYGERVGALSVVSRIHDADLVFGQLKLSVRRNYSSPPIFGAALVARVLGTPALRQLWESELATMRSRIVKMRAQLVDGLSKLMPERDFSFLQRQEGMFAYTGLSAAQVRALKTDHGVYAVETGRICIAGLNPHNISRVCAAFATVMRSA
ncbi:aromatic-amino-acid transaminase [Pseudomonas sp. 2725]|jgi:aromatic-amino-acid transaminase|uniref:amino acid aminotransferase n=1 Tax=Pseudomonas sp. 2725 TaxID=3156449 RepID=UPI003D2294B0